MKRIFLHEIAQINELFVKIQTAKLIKKIAFALTMLTVLIACSKPKNSKDYLREVLSNLEKIESATYKLTKEGWAPGDTAAYAIFYNYIKEFNNPLDSTIGASYVSLLQDDTTQMTFCYDGKMRANVMEDDKAIRIDSFNVRKLPFRPLAPPFFNYTKSIIRYALDTNDSISLKMTVLKESVYFCLTIFEDKQVEFFGKAYFIENPYFGDQTSKYEIWINKSNDLPFKVRREMSHDISVSTISNVQLNNIKIKDFHASDYFHPDYELYAYGEVNDNYKENSLVGKEAPDWVLKDVSDKTYSLTELKGKAIMIQFTSVSCGPCRASIPFLKELTSDYKKEDFDFVSVECTSKSLMALNRYQDKNNFNYRFLMSNKDVEKDYQVGSFPVFFILDKNRVISKVIIGYSEGNTDREIRNAINELIKKNQPRM